MKQLFLLISVLMLITCKDTLAPVADNAIQPKVITQSTPNDTDDPAIWVNSLRPEHSLILGTDKEAKIGGLYAFNLQGKIVNKVYPLDRPNNVDVAYHIRLNDTLVDIAVVTERNAQKVRIYSLPDLTPIDNGGINVFEDDDMRAPMGIATYRNPDNEETYIIVGRKEGKSGEYLYQYKLKESDGYLTGELVRKFGNYSGKKEIEAIAVDNELGYVYYSDETAGVRKYYADPNKGNEELAFFAQDDAKRDHEGIAIYKKNKTSGYILVSDQQANHFLVYKREGEINNPNMHKLIAKIPVSTIECDGADAINFNFGQGFEKGLFVAMSNGKVFQLYDWQTIEKAIAEFKVKDN